MSIKALATADLHLGKTSTQVSTANSPLPTKETWLSMVNYAIEQQVDLITIAGDLVDEDNRYFEAFGPLEQGFNKLSDHNITVYLVGGNHDYGVINDIVRSATADNVVLLGANGKWETQVFQKGDEKLELLGWSFPDKHVQYDPASPQNVRTSLDSALPTLGLVHGDLFDDQSRYAPLDSGNLSQLDVNGWIVGHIHKSNTIKSDSPFIRYPGSPQAMDPGEDGVHGFLMLDIEQTKDIQVEQVPFSPVYYHKATIDITGAEDENTFKEVITNELRNEAEQVQYPGLNHLVVDINLTGYHAQISELSNWSSRLGDLSFSAGKDAEVSVRKVTNAAKPKLENLEVRAANDNSAIGKLASIMVAIEKDEMHDELLDQLLKNWQREAEKLRNKNKYQPVQAETQTANGPEDAKQLIYEECSKLISELLLQENNDNSYA